MPTIRTDYHQRVKVGHTVVEFIDGMATVPQDISDVLLSLSGDNGTPEYFLVEDDVKEEEEEPTSSTKTTASPGDPVNRYRDKKTETVTPPAKTPDNKWKGQPKGRR